MHHARARAMPFAKKHGSPRRCDLDNRGVWAACGHCVASAARARLQGTGTAGAQAPSGAPCSACS